MRGLVVGDQVKPRTQRLFRAEAQTLQYMGKLTYQFNQDHSIALSLYGSPGESGGIKLVASQANRSV